MIHVAKIRCLGTMIRLMDLLSKLAYRLTQDFDLSLGVVGAFDYLS